MKNAKMTFVPTFHSDAGDVVVFAPVSDVPGFSHRVLVNNTRVGFLSQDFKPSAKTASYFLEEANKGTGR